MPAERDSDRAALIALLQHAHSGELAAAFAYRGHWKSLSDAREREEVAAIERDEWRHREHVGEMLAALGARPVRSREARAWLIGRSLGLLCHVSGWLAPMYGAGRLESRNIREYEAAARHARDAGHGELVECLLTMAEVEWDHERYFRNQVESHAWSRRLRIWPAPPPRASIRASFARAARAAAGSAGSRAQVHACEARVDA